MPIIIIFLSTTPFMFINIGFICLADLICAGSQEQRGIACSISKLYIIFAWVPAGVHLSRMGVGKEIVPASSFNLREVT